MHKMKQNKTTGLSSCLLKPTDKARCTWHNCHTARTSSTAQAPQHFFTLRLQSASKWLLPVGDKYLKLQQKHFRISQKLFLQDYGMRQGQGKCKRVHEEMLRTEFSLSYKILLHTFCRAHSQLWALVSSTVERSIAPSTANSTAQRV